MLAESKLIDMRNTQYRLTITSETDASSGDYASFLEAQDAADEAAAIDKS